MKIDAFENELILLRFSEPIVLVDCVVVDVEFKGELESRVDLFIFEFFIVEAYSL